MPDCSEKQHSCLIEIYHSNSWQSSKDRVLKEFKATQEVNESSLQQLPFPWELISLMSDLLLTGDQQGLFLTYTRRPKGLGEMERCHISLCYSMANKLDIVSKTLRTLLMLKAVFVFSIQLVRCNN